MCLKHDPNDKHKECWGTKSFFRIARVQIFKKPWKMRLFQFFVFFKVKKTRGYLPGTYVDLIEVCWTTNFKIFLPIFCGDTTTKFPPHLNAKFRITAKFRNTGPLRKFFQILWVVEIKLWNFYAIWIIFGRERGVSFTYVLSAVSYLRLGNYSKEHEIYLMCTTHNTQHT